MEVPTHPLEPADLELVEAARDALRRNEHPDRHGVGAAVRCGSGRVYAGINVEACPSGPCAEPVAIGTALTAGERRFVAIVAVAHRGDDFPVIPPCGSCRQLLVDYAPECMVILDSRGELVKVRAIDLLPMPYRCGFRGYDEEDR
jgi:cytidine deaminase